MEPGLAGKNRFRFRSGRPGAKRTPKTERHIARIIYREATYGECTGQKGSRGCRGSRNELSQAHDRQAVARGISFRLWVVLVVQGKAVCVHDLNGRHPPPPAAAASGSAE